MTYIPKSLDWFKERIGKRIYRDSYGCNCNHCRESVEDGLLIMDETHANYLCDIDRDFASEGTFMNYRDEK